MDPSGNHSRGYFLTAIVVSIVIGVLLISTFSSGFPQLFGNSGNTVSSLSSRTSTPNAGPLSSISTTMSLNRSYVPSNTTTDPTVTKAETNPATECNLAPKSTGIVVPVFSDYSPTQQQDVNEIIHAKNAYPSVPILAAINPNDGPGAFSTNISREISSLKSVNVTVIGYVPTNWSERSISSVEADIKNFYDWYHVQGIYLDQMPNWEYNGPQGQWYYPGPSGTYIPEYFTTLTEYIKSLGMTCVLGNSGADVPQNLLGTVSIIGIFENAFMPQFFGNAFFQGYNGSLTGINGWHMDVSKSNFAFFSYNISSYDPYYLVGASDYVSWLYLTNGTEPQPYKTLPPYFEQMVSTLASEISLKVSSEVLNGSSVINGGFAVNVLQPNGISSKGFTPFTFNVLPDSKITIVAENFGQYQFSHWSDGNTSRIRTLVLNESASLTAYYNVTG